MRIRVVCGALVVAAALLVGCGGGGSSPLNAGGSSGDNNSSGGGGGGGGALGSSDCVKAAQDYAKALGGVGGNSTDLDDVAKAFDSFANRVPSDLKDDVHTVANAMRQYAKDLKAAGVDFNDPSSFAKADQQKLEDAQKDLDDPKVKSAGDALSNYFEDKCGK
jgi:hypothetical protein